jgi:predicted enzyme related to lactoylglutathione lyase
MLHDSPVFSSFSVPDLAEAKVFYHDTLGCAVKDVMMGLQMDFPNGSSVYIYNRDDHQPASFTVLNFPVDDIDATIESLLEKGIAMERYDTLWSDQDEKGVLRGKARGEGPDIAWFKDPAGNILSVMEA